MFSAKHIGLLIVIVTLVAGNIVLYTKNSSLHEDVEALSDALTRPSDNEAQLEHKLSVLSTKLSTQREQTDRLSKRAKSLDELSIKQRREIAQLVLQVKALETEARRNRDEGKTSTQISETRATSLQESSSEPNSSQLTSSQASQDSVSEGGDVEHVVKRGDLLQDLARRYYGDQTAWHRILAANKDVVKDARSLRPGMVLIIPGARE